MIIDKHIVRVCVALNLLLFGSWQSWAATVIQVGAYADQHNITAVQQKLEALGLHVFTKPTTNNGRTLQRMLVGPLAETAVQSVATQLRSLGYPTIVLRNVTIATTPTHAPTTTAPQQPPAASLPSTVKAQKQPSAVLPTSREALFDDVPETPASQHTATVTQAPPTTESPASREALFDDAEPTTTEVVTADQGTSAPTSPTTEDTVSREALFGLDESDSNTATAPIVDTSTAQAESTDAEWSIKPTHTTSTGPNRWHGYTQLEAAHTYSEPTHWSKTLLRTDVHGQGQLTDRIKWHVGAQVVYDAVFDLEKDFYPAAVRHDQQYELQLRENYIDIDAGNFDFRFGKQHIVWGEMVGLFLADVVSARDMREFFLPDFDTLRIPQWTARAEYFHGDMHAELIWIPITEVDLIGEPGAEFYPAPAPISGLGYSIRSETPRARTLKNSNYGLRVSVLHAGWDVAGFVYQSTDIEPSFVRDLSSVPGSVVYQPTHFRISQFGTTVSKDLNFTVFKLESVYTHGRRVAVKSDLTDTDGLVKQDLLDMAMGLDFVPTADTRLNLQLFQRHVLHGKTPETFADTHEYLASLSFNYSFNNDMSVDALYIHGLNHKDSLLRPKFIWGIFRDWNWSVGLDHFDGKPTSFFGQYDDRDRLWSELRYSF